jgi:hypothetical protein
VDLLKINSAHPKALLRDVWVSADRETGALHTSDRGLVPRP